MAGTASAPRIHMEPSPGPWAPGTAPAPAGKDRPVALRNNPSDASPALPHPGTDRPWSLSMRRLRPLATCLRVLLPAPRRRIACSAWPTGRGRCGLPDLPRRRRLRRQARPFRPDHPGRAPHQGIEAALGWTLRRGLLARETGWRCGRSAPSAISAATAIPPTATLSCRRAAASLPGRAALPPPGGGVGGPQSRNGCRRPCTGQCGHAEDQQPHDLRAEDRLGLRRRPSWRRAISTTGATSPAPMWCRRRCRTRRCSSRALAAASSPGCSSGSDPPFLRPRRGGGPSRAWRPARREARP